MFVKTLSADGKYTVQYCDNLQLPIQMQLSEKPKNVCLFFVPFLESASNFKHFDQKDDDQSLCVSKLQTVKNFVTPLCKKCRFGTHLDSRHVKVSGILAKSR